MNVSTPVALVLTLVQTAVCGVAVWKVRQWDAEAARTTPAAVAKVEAPPPPEPVATPKPPPAATPEEEERALRDAHGALERARAAAYGALPAVAAQAVAHH